MVNKIIVKCCYVAGKIYVIEVRKYKEILYFMQLYILVLDAQCFGRCIVGIEITLSKHILTPGSKNFKI